MLANPLVVLGMSLVDGCLSVSRLPNAADILLSVVTLHTVPRVAPVVPHWLCSLEHL